MAFIVRLIEGSEPDIDLFYAADDDWSMLEKGFIANDPEQRQNWGGRNEDQLIREEFGRREIPLRLIGDFATVDALIDAVNAIQQRLFHAARFRTEGWGDEVFLRFQLHNATFPVDCPVCSGSINKGELMNACSLLMDGTGHREALKLEVGITVVCEAFWEATTTGTLENYVYNPGFWRGTVAPGDSWTEVDPGAVLTLSWETSIYEFMGRSLKWVIAPDAVNSVGITSDPITVVASTAYYFEMRGYHTAGCDHITAYIHDVTHGAGIAGTGIIFDNVDDAWEKRGLSFTTPAGCISILVAIYRLNGDSTAGNKTFYCDAFYLGPGTTAPVGWSSGRNLVNHLDAGADHLNVLCVAEIPGEVEAEVKFDVLMLDDTEDLYMAKRMKPETHNFIWELQGANATVTAGDAACIDSAIVGDATCPGGSRVHVSFATNTTMQLRCYWQIMTNLKDLFDRYMIALLAKKDAATDAVYVQLQTRQSSSLWAQGRVITKEIGLSITHPWPCHTGWELFSFPIGSHDGIFDAGDYWRICVYAQNSDPTPPGTSQLRIAGAYLIPLDAAAMMCGGDSYFATPVTFYVRQLDHYNGAYVWSDVANKRYPAIRHVGVLPTLTPKVENWFYFVTLDYTEVDITDEFNVSLSFRPRGIFLRGTNP